MASAEAKVVVIALLIFAVGFFYTSARDGMTGYVPAQRFESMGDEVATEEYALIAEESDQALPTEQPTIPSKERPQKEVSLQTLFPNAINPCSDNVPSQLQELVRGAC